MNKKRFSINLIGQILAFVLTIGVSFFISPYIIRTLGDEAYGFVNLINNFVSYLSIVTVALNGLCGRYITIAMHRNNEQEANEYFSSVFGANLLLAVASLAIVIFLSAHITDFLDIPESLVVDVQFTTILAFGNFAVSLLGVVYGLSTFVKNKLYISALQNIIGKLIYTVIIAIAFLCFRPRMWFITMAAFGSTVFSLLSGVVITHKLTPNLKLSRLDFKTNKIFEIAKAGIWMTVESLNKLFQTGLDLLITNVFVGAGPMGILSIAKTVPNMLTTLNSTIAGVYSPNYAELYAQEKKGELIANIKGSIKFLSFFMAVPLMGFLVFGSEFYSLWIPGKSKEEISFIQALSILTVIPLLLNSFVEGMYYINVLTNKIKTSVLVTTGFSVLSILTMIILLSVTNGYDLYIVAGVSSFYMAIRIVIFTPMYCAYILKIPKFTFYPEIIRMGISTIIVFILFMAIHNVSIYNTWLKLCTVCVCAGILGYFVEFLIALNKKERTKVIMKIREGLKNNGQKNRMD